MKIKMSFILKSGKVFENISEMTSEEVKKVVETVRVAFREDTGGCVILEDCIVRISECAVVGLELMSDEVQLPKEQ